MSLIPSVILASAHAETDAGTDFLDQQKQYARVRAAVQDKSGPIDRRLDSSGLKSGHLNILIVAYKAESLLELYTKKPDDAAYRKLVSWPICAASGKLGPKREKGDKQVPEGFYQIDRFNPASNFHLSLGINYPNAADRLKTRAADPGSDIFIHGSCVTTGCLPMTNAVMEEIYLYAVYARNSGQKVIPVYIFPFQMTGENMKRYGKAYRHQPELLAFWRNLQEGHAAFVSSGKALAVEVTRDGDYEFGLLEKPPIP